MTIMVSTRLPVQRAVAQVTVVTVTVTPAGEIIIYFNKLFIYLITSKMKGTARTRGRAGVGPIEYTPPPPMPPSGLPWASKLTPGRGVYKQHSIQVFYVWRGINYLRFSYSYV